MLDEIEAQPRPLVECHLSVGAQPRPLVVDHPIVVDHPSVEEVEARLNEEAPPLPTIVFKARTTVTVAVAWMLTL